jgi:hypothetical protein
MSLKTEFVKDIAHQITMAQFHELVARIAIHQAELHHEHNVAEYAKWWFYTGMHSEPDVANEIEALIREEH